MGRKSNFKRSHRLVRATRKKVIVKCFLKFLFRAVFAAYHSAKGTLVRCNKSSLSVFADPVALFYVPPLGGHRPMRIYLHFASFAILFVKKTMDD